MWDFLRKLLGRGAHPLNKIFISSANLVGNYVLLSKINPKVKIAPVLKSNGYGHGIVEVGEILDKECADWRVPFFCVDSLFEAYQLLKAKIKTPILIMGYIDPKSLMVKKLPFQYAVWDLELAGVINRYQKGAKVHLFVDTGMHREGILVEDLPEFIRELKRLENLELVGLMSHLSEGENSNSPSTKRQIKSFQRSKEICKKNGLKIKWFHLLNSPGFFSLKNTGSNVARMGRALYGIETSVSENELKPVLKLTTKIVQIKKIGKGEKVGYNGTYTAKRDMILGILPLGYHDGVDRRLSNLGIVLVDGVECEIVGLVSMNLTTVDLSQVDKPYIGQEVVVFSDSPKDRNSIGKSAQTCGTIPYDLLIHLTPSTKRVITV